MAEVYGPKEEPTITIEMVFDVDGIFHLWASIANYNAYRYTDQDPEVMPLDMSHPLMRISATITDMLDPLIAKGMKEGNYIAPLIQIKQLMADAIEGNGGI